MWQTVCILCFPNTFSCVSFSFSFPFFIFHSGVCDWSIISLFRLLFIDVTIKFIFIFFFGVSLRFTVECFQFQKFPSISYRIVIDQTRSSYYFFSFLSLIRSAPKALLSLFYFPVISVRFGEKKNESENIHEILSLELKKKSVEYGVVPSI